MNERTHSAFQQPVYVLHKTLNEDRMKRWPLYFKSAVYTSQIGIPAHVRIKIFSGKYNTCKVNARKVTWCNGTPMRISYCSIFCTNGNSDERMQVNVTRKLRQYCVSISNRKIYLLKSEFRVIEGNWRL